ncbi:MAG: hypothetical protein ACLVFV_07025, partial [Clostridium sp.]
YKKKQEQAKEYSRLADALSASQVLSDSDKGSVLEPERQGAASAGSSDLSAVSTSPAIGTTAGRNLLERAGLPVTGKTYLAEQLADYDYVMKHFYTVHPTAAAGRDMIQAETFLDRIFLKQETDSGMPRILIYTAIPRRSLLIIMRETGKLPSWGRGNIWLSFWRKRATR